MNAVAHRSIFLPVMTGLVVAAWAALALWSVSPFAFYVRHGNWLDLGPAAVLCRAVPGGDVVVPAVLHATGWLLMIVAMMLPTTLPLLEKFRRMTQGRGDAASLLALVVAGYVGVWFAFGLVAHALDRLLLDATPASPWLVANGWIVGAAVIAGAGAFQFTELKRRCLEKCRTPLSFVMQHWRGGHERRSALALGLHHGAFCLGCCWALMLLMFVVGTGSIGWMLALGAAMAVEKNAMWGRRISAPLGIALLAVAAATVAVNAVAA
jgi:predicted metal-binding membrane protein